jgi:hypothetical protein
MDDILAPRFIDPVAARKHLEALRWPDGAECPHCGSIDATRLEGGSTATGCSVQFVPRAIHRYGWNRVRAFKGAAQQVAAVQSSALRGQEGHLAHQIHRMLGVTYKTAWFMCHRIREAMKDDGSPLGGPGKIVESDEAFVGGSKRSACRAKPHP